MNSTIFNKCFLKNNKFLLIKGLCTIYSLEPKILWLTFLYSIISAIYPFINIFGISIIVDEIIAKSERVVFYTIILVIVNSLFYTFNNILHDSFFNSRRILFVKLKTYILDIIIELKSNNYDEPFFCDICNKENSLIKHQSNNPLFMICKMLYDFISGIISIILTLIIIKKVFITYSNKIFFSSKLFTLIILLFLISILISVGIISAVVSKKTAKINSSVLDSLTKFDYYWDYFNDFDSIKSIKIFSGIQFIINSIKHLLNKKTFTLLENKSNYFAKQAAIISIAGSVLAFVAYVLVGIKCYIGLFSIGELTRYISGFLQIVQGGTLIANGIGQIVYLKENLGPFFKLIDAHESFSKCYENDGVTITSINQIEFQNVSFKYDEYENYVLKNINLKINNNQKIAIVGENGAGKTTFIKLLLGIIKPSQGVILVNGVDLNKIKINTYIKNFSTVFQDYFLPDFTINEIITGDKTIKSNNQILASTQCSEFLKNIDLNTTYLGNEYNQDGINFSGGEKQKLAFARALHKNCSFYILDEPSSAMDAISEYSFYNSLNKLLTKKTIIFISHRLFSCVFSERILVFKDGEILEDDSFSNLRHENKSIFNELWNKQISLYDTSLILDNTV